MVRSLDLSIEQVVMILAGLMTKFLIEETLTMAFRIVEI